MSLFKNHIATILLILSALALGSCKKENNMTNIVSAAAQAPVSQARFTIANQNMFVVQGDNIVTLSCENYQLQHPNTSQLSHDVKQITFENNRLLIASNSGLHLYNQASDNVLQLTNTYDDVFGCDRFFVDSNWLFVALNDQNIDCNRTSNAISIVNLNEAELEENARIELSTPMACTHHDGFLFVCDEGVKIFDISNLNAVTLLHHEAIENVYDIQITDNLLTVLAHDGIYQFQWNGEETTLLSKLLIDPTT